MPTETEFLTRNQVEEMINAAITAHERGKDILDKKQIAKLLSELPEQTEREFETKVTKFGTNWDNSLFYKTETKDGKKVTVPGIVLQLIEPATKADITPEAYKLAFNAFCVLANFARRGENLSQLQEADKKYGPLFANEPFLLHLRLCREIKELEAFRRRDWTAARLSEMINNARINMQNLRGDVYTEKEPNAGNVGSAHILAETILLAFEKCPDLLDQIAMSTASLLEEALEVIEIVHRKDPIYAKFYCTHGRLLAVAGKFEDALYNLNIAIDKEDSSKADYPIRVSKYTSYIHQIRAQQQAESNRQFADKQLENAVQILEEQAESARTQNDEQLTLLAKDIEEKNKDSTTKSMEFLGLFSGIVSFTIGTISISTEIDKFSAKYIAGLIVVLMGALMAVFAGFGIILHGTNVRKADGRKDRRNLLVLLMGIAIVIGGYVLCLF